MTAHPLPRDEGRYTTPARASALASAREARHAALRAEVEASREAKATVDALAAALPALLAKPMRLPCWRSLPQPRAGGRYAPSAPSPLPLLAGIEGPHPSPAVPGNMETMT